jgi:hypothetical protein
MDGRIQWYRKPVSFVVKHSAVLNVEPLAVKCQEHVTTLWCASGTQSLIIRRSRSDSLVVQLLASHGNRTRQKSGNTGN